MLAYHGTLVEMKDDFKRPLTEAYTSDEQWKRAIDILKDDEEDFPEGLQSRMEDGLV